MTIFIIIIFSWLFIGLRGIAKCKENKTNWEMLIFLLFVPFIPFLAKIFL